MKKRVRKSSRKSGKMPHDAEKLNELLIENFVNMQKALTNLTVKFNSLGDQISSLLRLFETSARSFADKLSSGVPDAEKDREFLEKLDKLLDQNKIIAKGLTLMEEKMRERLYGSPARSIPQPPLSPSTNPVIPDNSYIPSALGKKQLEEI